MDLGIQNALRTSVATPLPQSWLGRADAPVIPPTWANINKLTAYEVRNLLAQIGYDLSQWSYSKIGTNNALGRYQFATTQLESYGLLANGSNAAYGTDCVNYRNCWRPNVVNTGINSYANYAYNVISLYEFLNSPTSQEHLAYQLVSDLYTALQKIDAIVDTDTAETIAGMIYVGWQLGVGTGVTTGSPQGTGAYAWRYYNVGTGANYYNSGRYAVAVLGK